MLYPKPIIIAVCCAVAIIFGFYLLGKYTLEKNSLPDNSLPDNTPGRADQWWSLPITASAKSLSPSFVSLYNAELSQTIG